MWENLRVIVISSVMTVLILAASIWMGIIPTQQRVENTYQIKQTIQNTFNLTGSSTKQTFTYPILNITGPAIARTIYIYAEFNVTENSQNNEVSMTLQLKDWSPVYLTERSLSSSDSGKKGGAVVISEGLSTTGVICLIISITGANVTGVCQGIIVQSIVKS